MLKMIVRHRRPLYLPRKSHHAGGGRRIISPASASSSRIVPLLFRYSVNLHGESSRLQVSFCCLLKASTGSCRWISCQTLPSQTPGSTFGNHVLCQTVAGTTVGAPRMGVGWITHDRMPTKTVLHHGLLIMVT